MQQQIIRLCYRKIIDANATQAWEKYVFDSSYAEFLMQSQLYNQEKKYTSFADLISHVPNAERLHFLVSASVTGYLQQLNGKIPDIQDNLGRRFLSFKNYRFEIINSDTKKKEQHQVAINFFSEPLLWHSTIGNYLLVSEENAANANDECFTNVLQLQPFLSIYSIKEKHYDTATS